MEDDDRKVCDCAADGRNGDLHFRDKANKQLDHSTFDFVVTAFVSKQSTSKKKNPSKFLWCLLITPWSLTPFKEGDIHLHMSGLNMNGTCTSCSLLAKFSLTNN